MLRIHTLGRPHVHGTGGLVSGSAAQPRRLAILALLATAGEEGLTREKVMAYVWPDLDEERARPVLNQAIYALRQDLGVDDVLIGTRDLRLNPALVSSDVAEFEQALEEGKLEEAAARYTGPFLDGFHLPGAREYERWAEEERAELARHFAVLLEKLALKAAERGDHKASAQWWQKLAAQDPLNAQVAVRLMQALVAAGDRAGALQHARIYEVLMEQELDAPPDREVVVLATTLRGAMDQPTVRVEPVAIAASPPEAEAEFHHPPAAAVTPAAAPIPAQLRPRMTVGNLVIGLVLVILGLGAGALLFHRGTPLQLVPGSARRVAFDQGLELDPALSPDGKMIAYAAESGDQFRIFVRQVDGGHAVPVSEALPGSHRRPEWSPDGSRIAFQAGGVLYEVPALGGVPRPLILPSQPGNWVAYPSWSPDGKRIAYVENWAIYVRPTAGGAAKQILERPAAHSLAWSPDGRWIAFVSGNPAFVFGESPVGSKTNLGNIAPSMIWVVNADGGAPVQVTDAQSLNTSPVWLPGGQGLLFMSDREGTRDIYRQAITQSGAPAGRPIRLTTGLSAHTFSLSGDGKELAYSVFTHTGNIWSLDLSQGESMSAAAARPFTEGTQVIEGMSLSPDGRWLAFDSDQSGNQDIYKMPVEGGEPVRLTNSPEDDFVSSWSGDGREIALHSYRGVARRVRIVSADGGEAQDVSLFPPSQRSPGLSPDGLRLVFTSDVSGQFQLYIISRDRNSSWKAAQQLTSDGGWAGRWSPDGQEIVYCRRDGLWIIGPQGGTPRQLVAIHDSTTEAAPELAQWSPDGRTIFYKAFDAAGRSTIWSVPATGGIPKTLVRFDDPTRPSSRPEFTTDGKRLFFTIGNRQIDIWVMELALKH